MKAFFISIVLTACTVIWWTLAFRPAAQPINDAYYPTNRQLSKERAKLQIALNGNVPAMIELILAWEKEARDLAEKGVQGIQKLSKEEHLLAIALGEIIKETPTPQMKKFLPQTFLSASVLLAISSGDEIAALPTGLENYPALFPEGLLKDYIPFEKMSNEELFSKNIDLAFTAHYSHPPVLARLNQQGIANCCIKNINTLQDIDEAILTIGEASNHTLEAIMLVKFIKAAFYAFDNRLEAHYQNNQANSKVLYLTYRQGYAIPTLKSLTGQLLARALFHCPCYDCPIPENTDEWSQPIDQEEIFQSPPDKFIFAIQSNSPPPLFNVFKEKTLYCLDETVQNSPAQHIILAYFDLSQALIL
ncbi:MAG: hypothetical protein LW832_05075 [Parachlamydia sp.]|jgi:iron complex transport system substrate-binding protein|nr:hypothetical protein [Parachlamydia sp.]